MTDPPAARPFPRGRAVTLSAVDIVRSDQREPFITLDGSEIRELAGIPSGNAANQSLAQATVPPGAATEAHYHPGARRSTCSPRAPAG